MMRKPVLAGLVTGILFMAAAFVPGLLPRPWYVQGVLLGLALAFGYGVGAVITAAWRRATGARKQTSFKHVMAALLIPVATLVWGAVVHLRWQVDIRKLMNLTPGAWRYLAAALALAIPVALLLVLIGRAFMAMFSRLLTWLGRAMPRSLAVTTVTLVIIVVAFLFLDLVVASRLVPALEEAHATSDRSFDPGVEPPTSRRLSGGPGSLIGWEGMGRQGRVFVSDAPTPAQIESFANEEAAEPIRIYVGLEIGDTAEGRAVRAIEEMERTGAFQREIIILIAPTGSGWIDPYSIQPLEYMYRGDTAAVAVQYSYLASWMVMFGQQDLATDASRALYRVVSHRLMKEPEATRPKVLLYGESLGAFGWERSFEDLDEVTEGADGVLWVGPPRVNPIWRKLVASRDPGSPLWRPVYQGGETVRFGPDRESLLIPESAWTPPRVVYLQHASDPITWLGFDVLTKRPEWLDPPRGPDVSAHMPFVPVVTFVQMAVDLALGTSAPLGHGHKFGLAQADAWALILPPSGWTDEDTATLVEHIRR